MPLKCNETRPYHWIPLIFPYILVPISTFTLLSHDLDTQRSCDHPPLSLWCHYQHTHHVTSALLLFPLHDDLLNGLFRPCFYTPTPHLTLHFSTQTISLSSHSTASPYDQLLLVILYSHSMMFSLLLQYTPLSQHSHSMTHSLLPNTLYLSQSSHSTTHSLLPYSDLSHTLPYVSRQSLLYILCQRWRRTSLHLPWLLIYLLTPKSHLPASYFYHIK